MDTDTLRRHLSLVETDFLGQAAKVVVPYAAPRGETMPVDAYPEDELYPVVVQYRLEGHGSKQDYDQRLRIETLLDDFLHDSDLGHVDGGDIGSGTMDVFCFVKSGQAPGKKIVEMLRENNMLEGATVAETVKGRGQVIWPPDFKGEFKLIYG